MQTLKESFGDRVQTCSVISILEILEHPHVGVMLVDYLEEVKTVKVNGSHEAIEIIRQTDGTLVLKSSQVLPILNDFVQWDAKRTLRLLEQSFSNGNNNGVTEFYLESVTILDTVKETLVNALERLGVMGDACLREIAQRSPSGKKFVTQLAANYQNRNTAKELFFKEADALYAQHQLSPRN